MVIKTSLIDWIGELEGGVGAFIAITIDDTKTLEAIYWVHPDGRRGLKTEAEFLVKFKVKKEEDLPFLEDLLDDIESVLPTKEEMFKTFISS